MKYLIALVIVLFLATDVWACSRVGGRARAVVGAEFRIVTAPFRLVTNRTTIRSRERVTTVQSVPTFVAPPVIVKCPCPTGGCPLPPPKTTTKVETKVETTVTPPKKK